MRCFFDRAGSSVPGGRWRTQSLAFRSTSSSPGWLCGCSGALLDGPEYRPLRRYPPYRLCGSSRLPWPSPRSCSTPSSRFPRTTGGVNREELIRHKTSPVASWFAMARRLDEYPQLELDDIRDALRIIRLPDLPFEKRKRLLAAVLSEHSEDLERGCVITAGEKRMRVRKL